MDSIDEILHYKQYYKENNTLPTVIENIEIIFPEALQKAIHEKYNISSDQLDPIDYLHFQYNFLEIEINWVKERLPSVKKEWKSKDENYYNNVYHTYNRVLAYFNDQLNEVQEELYNHGEKVHKSITYNIGSNLVKDARTFIWSGNGGLGQLYEKLHDKYISATPKDFMAVFGIGKLNEPVIWNGDQTLFAFFLDQLKPFIPITQYNKRFSIASKLFIDINGNHFDNIKLGKLSHNYQNFNKSREPKDDAIKEIFESIKF